MKNKWLQWQIMLKQEDNCIIVVLNEYVQDPEKTKWPASVSVAKEFIRIYPWTSEYSIRNKIVKIQNKLMKKYRRYENFWNKIKDIPPEYECGKIIIEDAKTLKLLRKYR